MRAADVEYKLPGESTFRTTTRPIHKLVLVIPVEEQNLEADKIRERSEPANDEAAEAATATPCREGRQTVSQAVPGREGEKSPAKLEAAPSRKEAEDFQVIPALRKRRQHRGGPSL